MTVLTSRNGHPVSGTTAQRTAITSWEPGETYYDTTLNELLTYGSAAVNGSTWQRSDGSQPDNTAFGQKGFIWYRVTYDWAVDGGAISTITPAKTVTLPVNTIIYGGLLEVITAATVSGSVPTIAVQAQAANDLVSAANYNGAPWSTTGIKAIVPVMTAATAVQVTSTAKAVKVVIGTAATLTALKFNVHLACMIGG
jgi:hypothetical protein